MSSDNWKTKGGDTNCSLCGKPRTSKGSMTAWIFRTPICQCLVSENALANWNVKSKPFLKTKSKSPSLRIGGFTASRIEVCKECGVTFHGSDHKCDEVVPSQRPTMVERALIGTIINHKYKIEGFVGRGGMSVVYRARHLLMGCDVALKLLRPQLIADNNSSLRFQIEAKAVSSLTHKNIIRMFEFGLTEDDCPFLAVEFLSGSVLSDILEEYGAVAPETALNWFCQIGEALVEAHASGVIHRDLKLSNIMIGTENDGAEAVKLLDFGIAKMILENAEQSRLTQTGEVFGSPMYMSPEQCLGKDIDHRSDIYSFGTLMYEMLSGTPPILGENVLDTIRKQLSDSPRPLKELAPDVSESLEYIVMRCLDKDPAWRYQSAKDLLADLLAEKAKKKIRRIKRGKTNEGGDEKPFRKERTTAALWIAVCLFSLTGGSAVAWHFRPIHKSVSPHASIAKQVHITDPHYKTLDAIAYNFYKDDDPQGAEPIWNICQRMASETNDDVEVYRCWRKIASCHRKRGDLIVAADLRNAFYAYSRAGLEDEEFLNEVIDTHKRAGVWYKHMDYQFKALPLSESIRKRVDTLAVNRVP